MAVIISENFDEGQAAFQAAGWTVFSPSAWPTLFPGGVTRDGYWVSCTNGNCRRLFAPYGTETAIRSQLCLRNVGNADYGELYYAEADSLVYIPSFYNGGSFGFRMNNVSSEVLSPGSGLFPEDGTMFGFQLCLTITGGKTVHAQFVVNNVIVWDLNYDWSAFSGTGATTFRGMQFFSLGSTVPAPGFRNPDAFDTIELDTSAAVLDWPAVPNRSMQYGCTGLGPVDTPEIPTFNPICLVALPTSVVAPVGCTVPLPAAARPANRLAPPPNPVDPEQFSPAGLADPALLSRALVGMRPPLPDADSPTAYVPVDRAALVADAIAAFSYPSTGTAGERAFAALEVIVAAIFAAEEDQIGFLRWVGPGTPSDDLTAIRQSDGVRYWANAVVYADGAFYWVLGGLGGYGVQPYWRFGGLTDPGLYVPYS